MFYALAFLCAVLSGLGVGSAGILVVLLSVMRGTEHISAQGINLVFFIISSFAALLINLRKRFFYPKIIITMGLFGIIGSILGAKLALTVNPNLIRKIFGGMLVGAGVFSLILLGSDFVKNHKKRKYFKKHFTK